jgi:hypothetical protein
MTVADITYANARNQIEIFFAVFVNKPAALCLFYIQREGCIGSLGHVSQK